MNSRLVMKKWPPNANVTGYSGPYPVNEIQKARNKLIQCLTPPHHSGLAIILPKIGIDSCFGPAIVPPPPQSVPNGMITSDNYTLAPEKATATAPLSVTMNVSSVVTPPIQLSGWTPLRISRSVSVHGTRQDTSDNYTRASEKTVATSPLSVTKNVSSIMSPPVQISDWTPLRSSGSVSVRGMRQDSVHQTDHTRHEGSNNSAAQSASITNRRHSDLSWTDNVPVKMARDNILLMANKHRGQGDASLTQDVTRVGEPSTSYGTTKLPPSHVYKCDYCRVTAQTDAVITNHLTRSRHASASEYTISTSGDGSKGGPELQAVERMLAVSNPEKGNCAALVIACPECRSIFDDIFTCATHNKYEHGESDGCYAICPVIHSELVKVGDTSCPVCQQRFNDYDDLVDHWATLPEHCPMPQSTDSRVFLVQTCPVCKRTFNDFLDCVIHMAGDHGTVTWVEVRHVMLPQRRERLPPFNCNRHSTGGLRDEAAILSKLQNCFEQNAINARLEQIKKILAGVA